MMHIELLELPVTCVVCLCLQRSHRKVKFAAVEGSEQQTSCATTDRDTSSDKRSSARSDHSR